MTAKHWIKTPKSYVTLTMVAFLLLASVGTHETKGIINGVIAVLACVGLDVLISVMKGIKRIMPDGAVITGLIIALILGTTTSWLTVIATAFLAILTKQLLVYKRKPIFNPAALGLLLSVIFFHTEQSWWGAFGDLPAWTILFLLIGGYIIADRVNKFPQVFAFLATVFTLIFIMGQFHMGAAVDALRPPFINATLFFGFFMLTDPPTSPAKTKDQLIFSILVAVAGILIYGLFGGLIYLFIGLLLGNLYHIIRKVTKKEALKAQHKTKRSRSISV